MASHLRNIARSTWDLSLAGEVARQPARRTVGYFAIVLLLSSLAVATGLTLRLRAVVWRDLAPEIDKLPVVKIRHGQVSTNVPQPWRRQLEDTSTHMKTILVIDTTGQVTDFAPDEQGAILMKTQLLLRNPQNPFLQPIDLRAVDDLTIDAAHVKAWIPTALWIAFGALLVILPFWYTCARLLVALLLGLVGLIAATGRKRKLDFGALYCVGLYALTPAIALDVALSWTGLNVPMGWLVYFAVAAVYTVLGVLKIPDPDPAMPAPPPQAQPQPPASSIQGAP